MELKFRGKLFERISDSENEPNTNKRVNLLTLVMILNGFNSVADSEMKPNMNSKVIF